MYKESIRDDAAQRAGSPSSSESVSGTCTLSGRASSRESQGDTRKTYPERTGPMSSAKQGALECAREHGWSVFRLHIGHDDKRCDGGTFNCKKVQPLDSWRSSSSDDLEVIESWDWSRANAYGIDCGKSGIVVVDRDPGDTWPYTETRIHSTGRGEHYIYEDLIGLGNQAGLAPWGVDVRGVGGVIIGPGSYHPHGEYEVANDVPPGDAPVELISSVYEAEADERDRAAPLVLLDAMDALDRLNGVYRRMASVPEGKRNDMLNRLAGTAAGLWVRLAEQDQNGELSEEVIRSRLLESVTNDDDPAGSRATIESGWQYGLANPTEDVTAEVINRLFDATPTLRHIRRAAHSRALPAPGVLANCLSLVLLRTDPAITLPPVVGARAALNLGFALVGESGASKTASAKAAREVLGCVVRDDWIKPIGSGEGLIDAFYRWAPKDPDNPEGPKSLSLAADWDRRMMVVADEGEIIEKGTQRSGSTLGEYLRTSLTGGMLGAMNRKTSPAGDRSVPADTYRLVFVANIHPRHADVLLSGESTGMPQRFLWVLAKDAALPESAKDLPKWPEPLDWSPPELEPGDIDYPANMQEEVQQLNLDMQHGKLSARESHATLTRLKVALALALLHGETMITQQWWGLAGVLSKASLATQDWCLSEMSEDQQKARTRRAKQDVRANTEAVAVVADEQIQKAGKAVVEKLHKHKGEWISWHDVRPAYRLRKGLETDHIIEWLQDQPGVSADPDEGVGGKTTWQLRYE